jgi:hypothetical protein
MEKSPNKKNKNGKWIFLGVSVIIYLSIFFVDSSKMQIILNNYIKLLLQILPVFSLVYLIMLATNYFVNNKDLKKHMAEGSKLKVWTISIIAGIISVGPIYIWYPLMQDLQKKGVKDRYLSTFLYNRGIKLQWLPMLILYFGLKYSVTLLIVMAILSIPQGIITEKLAEKK